MALIKCKECGKEFSDMADACPNCGYNPTRAKEKAMGLKPREDRKSKSVLIFLTFFFWWVGAGYFYLGKIGSGLATIIAGGLAFVIDAVLLDGYVWHFRAAFIIIWGLAAVIRLVQLACMDQLTFDKKYNSIETKKED